MSPLMKRRVVIWDVDQRYLPAEDTCLLSPGVEVERMDQAVPERGVEKSSEQRDRDKDRDKEKTNNEPEDHESEESRGDPVQEQGEAGVRRSTRQRAEPDRLTYQSLGNP